MANPHRIGFTWSRIAFVALSLGMSGCGFLDGCGDSFELPEDDSTDGDPWIEPDPDGGGWWPQPDVPPEDPGPTLDVDVSACSEGIEPWEIQSNLVLASTFAERVAALDDFSAELRRFSSALGEGASLLDELSPSHLPEGYVDEGEGVYALELEGFDEARMEVRFFLARDYSFGVEGDLVTADPFALSSYLLDPVVTTIDGSHEISHAGPGPLAELLGYGVEPPNPVVLAWNELAAFGDDRLDLMLEANVRLADSSSDAQGAPYATVDYEVKVPRRTATSVHTGEPISLHVVEAQGHREDLAQELAVDRWSLARDSEWPSGLQGELELEVSGGYFDFVAVHTYEAATEPDVRIRCAW